MIEIQHKIFFCFLESFNIERRKSLVNYLNSKVRPVNCESAKKKKKNVQMMWRLGTIKRFPKSNFYDLIHYCVRNEQRIFGDYLTETSCSCFYCAFRRSSRDFYLTNNFSAFFITLHLFKRICCIIKHSTF